MSGIFPILIKTERDRSKMSIGYSCQFQCNLKFLYRFWKNTQVSNFMKIRSLAAEMIHADGRTDMTKPIVAFPNFSTAPKMEDVSTGGKLATVHGL